MSETVKLVIEIPKETYLGLRGCISVRNAIVSVEAIHNGVPLDDVKAEIEQNCQEIDTISHNEYENAVEQGKEIAYENVLSILDNIGKAESEDKE